MKILILFSSILIFVSCVSRRNTLLVERYELTTQYLDYDTLEGDFLYEMYIEPYLVLDAFVKSNNFINAHNVDYESYKKGYYVFNPRVLANLKRNHNNIRYDSLGVNKFYSQLYRSSLLSDFNNTYVPMIGLNYKKVYLKVEVLYLGNNRQLIPAISKENDSSSHIKTGFAESIPTYVITKVFNMKEK